MKSTPSSFEPQSAQRPDGIPMLTPSHIIQYMYCPRFTYFEYVLRMPQHEEKFTKVMKGRQLHEYRLRTNAEYLRRRLGVVDKKLDQYLGNSLIRGIVDEVLWLEDGNMAPLDYKFAQFPGKVYRTYATQLACYACLIEDNYQLPVNKGFLVYTRSKNKVETVDIGQQEKQKAREAAQDVLEIIQKGRFPKATRFKSQCTECTYRNVCVK